MLKNIESPIENFTPLETLGNCTYQEVRVVAALMNSPNRRNFVNGESGGCVASLHKKGIVEKVVRVGRTWQWKLKEEFCGIQERSFIKERASLNL